MSVKTVKLIASTADIVQYDPRIGKYLDKLPSYIAEKLRFWATTVNNNGIAETRKNKGFHDEPLHGNREGQRSIRLNSAYRAIYVETKDIIKITAIEVNKHGY